MSYTPTEEPDMDLDVHNAPDRQRYEAYVDGELAGQAEYRRNNGTLVFTHTEVGAEFRGTGVAGRLVRGALDDARYHEFTVRPECPYVARWITRHPEYADLVLPADAELLPSRNGDQDSASR
ncbi:GNAT family N-acetyltransferase [Gandjariella thermophila]|uniref:N-acetyltransferase n=1 Tax=Gandjariella thermophila TaxID=1931992 RepID=A0A4D4J9M1_9PSEU|nr:GNAT family N-acetyltransferase [Gandjariella thermophila]GDY30637.1 N-acetyltransferase [Gandjariella thermophila]